MQLGPLQQGPKLELNNKIKREGKNIKYYDEILPSYMHSSQN